jgi:hypothetical protein
MSDPFLTDDPEEGDLTLDPLPARSPGSRQPRSDTASNANVRRTPVSPFRRVVSRDTGPAGDADDIDALAADPATLAPVASWDTSDRSATPRIQNQALPALQRNKVVDLLESVHDRDGPAALEHRVSAALRFSAIGALALVVVLVLGSMYYFRAKPAGGASAARPEPAPVVRESAVDPQAEVAEAELALRGFLAAPGPADRQRLIGAEVPMPAFLGAPGPVPILEKVRFSSGGARVVRLGPDVAVLFPMIDHSGVERTAALLKRGGSYQVDWRSAVTPEPVAWNEFVAAPAEEPRLFRVELSAGPATAQAGGLQVHRPTGSPATVTVSVDPRSRVGEEIHSALLKRGGKPLAADVFLAGTPDGRLEVVGWTRDKWAL